MMTEIDMFKRLKKSRSCEKGSAMVELSISLPVLLLLMFGVVELSGFMLNHFKASRVAYEGARYLSTSAGLSGSGADVNERMAKLVSRYELPEGTETSYQLTQDPANFIEVNVIVPFSFSFVPMFDTSVRASARAAYLYHP